MKLKVKHKKYKTFAGPVLYGRTRMNQPDADDSFLERLVYVTSVVESGGFYGSIFMADGTGITGGLCQHVSVLPKSMAWGDFWKLIAYIDSFFPVAYYDLGELLDDEGWTFQPDGVLRDVENNIEVPASLFRNTVTPLDGTVPELADGQSPVDRNRWLKAKEWCLAAHQILAQPTTHRPQLIWECRQAQKRIQKTRFHGLLKGKSVEAAAFPRGLGYHTPFGVPHVEVAMLVFLSFAVNAPKWAYTAFDDVLQVHGHNGFVPCTLGGGYEVLDARGRLFAVELIKALEQAGGTKWDDDRRYGRYQRTRDVLLTMYDEDVIADVMPKDLPEEP